MGQVKAAVIAHTEEPACVFCRDHEDVEWYNTPLAQDRDVTRVLPAVGAIVPGYVLVVPSGHVTGICRIAVSERAAFVTFVDRVAAHLGDIYDTGITIFEHAASDTPDRARAACIAHAHVHLVPGVYDLRSAVGSRPHEVHASLREFISETRADPYLMLRDPGGPVCTFSDQPLPQYFRRIIARRLGLEDKWDYALFPFWDNVAQTCADFAWQPVPDTPHS